MARNTAEVTAPPSTDPIQHLQDLLQRTDDEIGNPDGLVLALSHAAWPRVTGWFRPNASSEFLASFPRVVRGALANSYGRRTSQGDVTVLQTWEHVQTGTVDEAACDFWLYRRPRLQENTTSAGSRSRTSSELKPLMLHIASWSDANPSTDDWSTLSTFSRSLNATVSLKDVGDVVAGEFRQTLNATGVVVELCATDDLQNAIGSSGVTPIQSTIRLGRGPEMPSTETIDRAETHGWIFDVFALAPRDGLAIGTVTCFWSNGSVQPGQLPLANLMAEHASAAIERAQSTHRSSSVFSSAVSAFADAVDARDAFTRHHACHVARYSRAVAEELGLSQSDIQIVEVAGLLHDIGKIGVPDRVLQMSGELEPDDWDLVRRHPEIGSSLVLPFADLVQVAPLIRHHHERFDGTGYPDGLKGDEIPLGARIIGVVETFDTLISGRPYQSPWGIDRTLATLESMGGTQFDAAIVKLFNLLVRSGAVRVDMPVPTKTSDLDVHRWIGSEARAFGLLQRISNEVGELVEIGRFLSRLKEILQLEFPESVADVFIRDREHDHLIALPDGSRPHLAHNGVYVMQYQRGVVGWVARHAITQNVNNTDDDPRYVAPGDKPMRSELAVPMLIEDTCVGVLNLESPHPGAYSSTDERVLEAIASYVARAIQVAELHGEVKQQTDIDSMTGLLNHRAFFGTLEREVERATRTKNSLSIAIIDIDAFKRVNDSKGHLWGDAIIRRVAEILSASVRQRDAVARYGGDEFGIIMPGATREAVERRMQHVRRDLRTANEVGPLPQISWGISSFPDDGLQPTELVARADAAMYTMKQRSVATT